MAEPIQDTSAHNIDTPLRIVLVDDEPFNLHIFEEFLQGAGHETVSFNYANAAWDYLKTHENDVDIIVLDRMLPHIGGLELVERLHVDEAFRPIPVIMVSAASEDRQVYEGKKSWVYDYLTKPFEGEKLLQVIDRAMEDVKSGRFHARMEAP